MPVRTVLHVDMDAFFASVEQRDDPRLRGRPVLVGGSGSRAVVTAASYESRPFGCRSAMPMAQARRLCPQAIVVPVRFERYREVSEQVFTIFERYTPLVQPLSIDEAFLDVTGSRRLHGDGKTIAERLRADIRRETQLTASVGVAPNKFLAKLASDLRKPDGLVVVDEAWIRDALPALPIGRMWGVGPASEAKFLRLGLRTFGDLAVADRASLERIAGADAARLQALARGDDERQVETDRTAKSIGQERTFGVDLASPQHVRDVLLREVESIARRLRRAGMTARTVSLKIRFGDFQTISRSATRDDATDSTTELWTMAAALFDTWSTTGFRPVRLIGASLSQLSAEAPLPGLFAQAEMVRRRAVDAVEDRIVARFGADAVRRGGARKSAGRPLGAEGADETA